MIPSGKLPKVCSSGSKVRCGGHHLLERGLGMILIEVSDKDRGSFLFVWRLQSFLCKHNFDRTYIEGNVNVLDCAGALSHLQLIWHSSDIWTSICVHIRSFKGYVFYHHQSTWLLDCTYDGACQLLWRALGVVPAESESVQFSEVIRFSSTKNRRMNFL